MDVTYLIYLHWQNTFGWDLSSSFTWASHSILEAQITLPQQGEGEPAVPT